MTDRDTILRAVVKPLPREWKDDGRGYIHAWSYRIRPHGPRWALSFSDAATGLVADHPTLAAAQAAAEADYRARMGAALDLDKVLALVAKVDAFRKRETDENYSEMLRAIAALGEREEGV